MGVRGLTTYIGQNADRYMDPFELHDCNLVVDGDSLSSTLYKWVSNCNSAFGGNYDQYYRTVCNFFGMLQQCNVAVYVLLDGGYHPKKLNTVRQRLRSKIGAIKYLNPFDARPMFPIMMREVFIEALEHCGIPLMRCLFEADDEVAALARRLQCPVLSYDSDFYIHNVMYIPSVTLQFRVFRRNIPSHSGKGGQRKEMVQKILETGETCKFKVKKVEEDQASPQKISYYYMDCSLYRIENMVRDRRLRKEMLPLFAVLLGNDYISSSLFRKFYSNVSLKGTGKHNTPQAKRIIALLRWLQTETLASAVAKIIGHVEKEKKQWLQQKMELAMNGYSQEHSEAYVYFGFASGEAEPLTRDFSFSNNCESSDDESDENDDDNDDDEINDVASDGVVSETSDKENEDEIIDRQLLHASDKFVAPAWLRSRLLDGSLPRYIVDLLNLKLYVNAPQVENFDLPDCNVIAIDILRLIFTILHAPNTPELRYLSRVQRRTDIEYNRFACIDADIQFDSSQSENFETFKYILMGFNDADQIISAIEMPSIPSELRLFYLTIIYWSRKSEHMNLVHICSLILNHLVLNVIEKRIDVIRSRAKFTKIYDPLAIKKRKPATATADNIEECSNGITKDECILAQTNLLEFFDVNARLRTKHTEFSSQILHGFAEFQAIAYQMNCLNALCGERYTKIRMSECYNGCFLYNAYVALKDRPNVHYYVEHFLLPDSPHIHRLFEMMLAVLAPFVPCVTNETISKRRKKRNVNKKKAREARKQQEAAAEQANGVTAEAAVDVDSCGSDYEDLNNKFSCLLKH